MVANKTTRTFRNKEEVVLTILRENRSPLDMIELAAKAQQLHSLKAGLKEWRAFIKWHAKKHGVFLVKTNDDQEFVSLDKWTTEKAQTKATEAEPEPEAIPQEIVPIVPKEKILRYENGVAVLPTVPENFRKRDVPPFVDHFNGRKLLRAHRISQRPIIIEGPAGEGKTMLAYVVADELDCPIVNFNCTDKTKEYDFIGSQTMRGTEVVFSLGAVPLAIELANKTGLAVLNFDEINSLNNKMQKFLNSATDWRRSCYVPILQKIYSLHGDAQIIIMATMNPMTFTAGLHELNRELKGRFSIKRIGYPSNKQQMEILNIRDPNGDFDLQLKEQLIQIADLTRKLSSTQIGVYPISSRDLHQFMDNYKAYLSEFSETSALSQAIETCFYNKFEDKEKRAYFRTEVERIFNVQLPGA